MNRIDGTIPVSTLLRPNHTRKHFFLTVCVSLNNTRQRENRFFLKPWHTIA